MLSLYTAPARQVRSAPHGDNIIQHIRARLTEFDPISLAEIEHAALLNRIDTKYVMTTRQLYAALQPDIAAQYAVLEISGRRLNTYQTLYFDTPNFALYRQHHNGQRPRYKIRVREYTESDLSFFEIKRKTNKGRSIKSRFRIPSVITQINGQPEPRVDELAPFDARQFEPKLWNDFLQITLVHKEQPERLTLDMNLSFRNIGGCAALPGLVIVEIKQESIAQHSSFVTQMRQQGIRPMSFSFKATATIAVYYDA